MKKTISLFSNIGVGEWYLKGCGFDVVAASELEEKRCKVFEEIYPDTEVIQGDITDEATEKQVIEAAGDDTYLLMATPPCQGFSTLNPIRTDEDGNKKKPDERNNLVKFTFDLIAVIKPKYALIENVPQMVKAFDKEQIDAFMEREMPGYSIQYGIVNAADHGTPQHRRRMIVLLTRKGEKVWELPSTAGKRKTLEEAIGKLPPLESGEKGDHRWHFAQKHSANHVEWMRHTPTGKSALDNDERHQPHVIDKETGERRRIKGFSNTYKRMRWDEPAPTLIKGSHMISSSNTVHPGRPRKDGTYSDARTLSVLEAMIVMGLPRDWPLPKDLSYTEAIQFLGEGFCPKVVKALVENL